MKASRGRGAFCGVRVTESTNLNALCRFKSFAPVVIFAFNFFARETLFVFSLIETYRFFFKELG